MCLMASQPLCAAVLMCGCWGKASAPPQAGELQGHAALLPLPLLSCCPAANLKKIFIYENPYCPQPLQSFHHATLPWTALPVCDCSLLYKDLSQGEGELPGDGQEVIFQVLRPP